MMEGARFWSHAARLGVIAGLAFLGLLDFALATSIEYTDVPPSINIPVTWTGRIAGGLVAAGLMLSSTWLTPRWLVGLVIAQGAGSLAITVSCFSAGDLVGPPGLVEVPAQLVLLIVVCRRAAAAWVAPAAGVLIAAILLRPFAMLADDALFLTSFGVIAVGAAIGAGVYLRSLDSGRLRQVAAVQAEQRAEFARDLHDFIAHHVTGIVVQAQGARLIAAADPQRAITALEQIENAGQETMASMRRMVGLLRSMDTDPGAPVAPLAGMAEIGPLVDGFGSNGSPTARLRIDGEVDDLPIEVTSSAYRVVMEALTNVRRHANGATRVDVTLHRTPDCLFIRVADDGRPARAALPREVRRDGFGLIGLTERVRAVGGRIEARPGIDGGWVVDAALPVTHPLGTSSKESSG
jgi:signal transduction histidine kinase